MDVSLNADMVRRDLYKQRSTRESTLLMSESEIWANNIAPGTATATEEPARENGFLDLESFRQQKRWICYAQLCDSTLTGKT